MCITWADFVSTLQMKLDIQLCYIERYNSEIIWIKCQINETYTFFYSELYFKFLNMHAQSLLYLCQNFCISFYMLLMVVCSYQVPEMLNQQSKFCFPKQVFTKLGNKTEHILKRSKPFSTKFHILCISYSEELMLSCEIKVLSSSLFLANCGRGH